MSTDSPQPDLPAKGQFLVYPAEDGRTKIEVRLEDETVWLTQQHMADLFQTTQQNISLHLQNIYDEGELQRAATHKEYLSVRQEGSRQVKRPFPVPVDKFANMSDLWQTLEDFMRYCNITEPPFIRKGLFT